MAADVYVAVLEGTMPAFAKAWACQLRKRAKI